MGKKQSFMVRQALDIRWVLIALFSVVLLREFFDPATASKRATNSEQPPAVVHQLEQAKVRASNKQVFLTHLREGYFQFARAQDNAVTPDWSDAHYFRAKALTVHRGQMVPPEALDSWDLAAPGPGIFASARERLIGARNRLLIQPDVQTTTLSDLANAQVYFDCWIERAEEKWNSEDAQYCRYMFESSLEAAYPQYVSTSSSTVPLYQ